MAENTGRGRAPASVFDGRRELLALLYEAFGLAALPGIRILVDETIALVFRILIAVQLLGFHALLCQMELAPHDKRGKLLALLRVRIVLERILGRDDARLVIVSAAGTVAELRP